tara:strand:+ start:116 stop:406 length:291 start_codon:yes stop_codon:yes gene_type:complete
MQAAAKGKAVSHYLQAVSPTDVLNNKRYKVLGTPLKDWLVCSQCKRQQLHHAQNGNDFERKCWSCGAGHTHFMYMDELARELIDEGQSENLYRFKR